MSQQNNVKQDLIGMTIINACSFAVKMRSFRSTISVHNFVFCFYSYISVTREN